MAIATFRDYVTGLIREEKGAMGSGIQKNQHLVAALVRACASEEAGAVQGMRNMILTEEEIISSLFVFAFAGNDVAAISLNNMLINLAAHPETREWIAEEIRHYLFEDVVTRSSYQTFPKLKRCFAVVVGCIPMSKVQH